LEHGRGREEKRGRAWRDGTCKPHPHLPPPPPRELDSHGSSSQANEVGAGENGGADGGDGGADKVEAGENS
jgi:hypothetical protein